MKLWIASLLLIAGCKQGPGDRCQVDSDCAEGTCSQAEPKVCGGGTSSQLDASVPVQIDAGPIDAGPEAGI